MNRTGHETANFFRGTEVERTPAHGKPTLFVVGLQTVEDISAQLQGCEHIFFGANHSFNPGAKDYHYWHEWEQMIEFFLKRGYLCSLDIPVGVAAEFNDGDLCSHNNFIPQIRVPLPYIKLWNYNTMIKIDDLDFDATNPGVWCHSLHSLMARDRFTDWRDYAQDQIVS
jgi:hypothetical protein